jgi:hypothetical protein
MKFSKFCTPKFSSYHRSHWSTIYVIYHNFWCNAWKMFYFCAKYTFLMYRLESVLFVCAVHISDAPSGKCSIFVHITYFWYTVWKVFCLCAHCTFLMYRLNVLFLCTVHISDVPSGKCSTSVHSTPVQSGKCYVSVHSTHFWCTALKLFYFCAQYKFLMYRLESVLFVSQCTILIYNQTTTTNPISFRFILMSSIYT